MVRLRSSDTTVTYYEHEEAEEIFMVISDSSGPFIVLVGDDSGCWWPVAWGEEFGERDYSRSRLSDPACSDFVNEVIRLERS